MPSKKRLVKKRLTTRKPSAKRHRKEKVRDNTPVLINIVRDMCCRCGLAMARFEFKGKDPKPSIDEFRERIVHHIDLTESSVAKAFPVNALESLEKAGKMLKKRLELEIEKIRNGANSEVETVYDSLT